MAPRRRSSALAVALAVVMLLQHGHCSRPTPTEAADGLQAAPFDPGHAQSLPREPQHSRRQLLERTPGGAAPSAASVGSSQQTSAAALPRPSRRLLVADTGAGRRDPGLRPGADAAHMTMFSAAAAAALAPQQAAAVGLMCSYQLEQLVAGLASRGLRLASQAQQEDTIAALVVEIERLAEHAIHATRADIDTLRRELHASAPAGISPEEVTALLHDSEFQENLHDARDDAMLAVGAALQPHLPALAQSVHAVLGALVLPPDSMEELAAFSGTQIPELAATFTSSMVDVTLLQTLWHD